MSLRGFGTVALLAIAAASCHHEETRMQPNGSVFDLIARLPEKLPFRHEDVTALTGVALARNEQTSNSAYDMYESTGPKGAFAAVEVRQRVEPKPGKNGMVILDLAPGGACIRQKEAIARYGDPADLGIPSPHGPADQPTYLIFKQKWGELRLGFSRAKEECLVSVVLDAIEKS